MSDTALTANDPEESSNTTRGSLNFPVVGIGASAGGLPAMIRFFEQMPARNGMAFVIILHLSPSHESNAAEILQRATSMPVVQVTKATRIEADHVYVIPPASDLLMNDGYLRVVDPTRTGGPHVAIDLFFRTLAHVHRERAVCVVMSGTGADGAVGLARVKEQGGLTFVQSPEDAEHDGMPLAAIASGMADFVMPAAELPGKMMALWANARRIQMPVDAQIEMKTKAPEDQDAAELAERALTDIMGLLRRYSKHDFRHYKRATVLRRIERRLQVQGLPDLPAYRDYLRQNPDEATPLLQDMLISVTNFFRDREAFEALEREAMPTIFHDRSADDPVRAWVTGCATGEEAYSVAILMREQALLCNPMPELQVFASDISDKAIGVARTGLYPSSIVTDVPPTRLRNFFTREQDQYRIIKTLREKVLFANHNLLRDPPFSRLDLICCRNVLIYLDREAQVRILEMFRFALKPGGYLFLGISESADVAPNLFTPVDKKNRIYRANPLSQTVRHVPTVAYPLVEAAVVARSTGPHERRQPSLAELHQRCMAQYMPPSVLIDSKYDVLHLAGAAGQFLEHAPGKPSRSLLANVNPELRIELRTALFRITQSSETAKTRPVALQRGTEQRMVAITVKPFLDPTVHEPLYLVVFEELEGKAPPPQEAGDAAQQAVIDEMHGEIRQLKAHLQDYIEQSETSTEELKASNEELQAINEELRSATEELETSKEELQSMNEELITVNFELKSKVEETAKINDDLKNFIAASDIATVFIDKTMRIKRYTPQAVDIFNLIPSDLNRPLLDIKDRLNYESLASDAEHAFQTLQTIERAILSPDGKHYLARIRPYRTTDNHIDGAVLTFVDVTALRKAEEAVRRSEERLHIAAETTKDYAILTVDEEGLITTWNAGAERVFGYKEEEVLGQALDLIFTPEDVTAGAPQDERLRAATEGRAEDERWHVRKGGERFYASGIMTPLGSGLKGFSKIARDMTGMKHQQNLRDAELAQQHVINSQAQAANELKDKFLAVMSHELKHPLNLIQVNTELLVSQPGVRGLPLAVRTGDIIRRAVASQAKIIDDLLDLSRARTGKLTLKLMPVPLDALVASIVQASAENARNKGIGLVFECAEDDIQALCDRVRTEQICWNLINNALKFTPEGGKVTVHLARDAGFARLSVVDTGVGIAEDFLPEIFGMFSQGPKATESGGLGVGLALVNELATAQGGRVSAESKGLGHGASFSVWLPLEMEDTFPDSLPAAPDIVASLEGLRILAVDDMLDGLEPFAALMRIDGAVVDTADSGEKALQALTASSYDLMISDLGMAGMDGFALIQEIRKRAPLKDFPAIALSGYGRQADVDRALEMGFTAHLSKPATLSQVRDTVSRLNLKRRTG
ncbi:MAG TPA: chemotaxis protein CheB [Polaromonas sp.]|uniref:CheR family methyltransferase n=1 Tax=Polaromonas sp. TaxID=1869339 RepID=UPI002D2CC8B4|nr:chemotaxis protein CheB [Polaromonas sp.]HYW57156.1 chemotaxis protein CheB [Polaromonas sp.]